MIVPPTDSALVDLAAGTYQPGRIPFISSADGAADVFVTRDPDITHISVEGTHNVQGWAADFFALYVADTVQAGAAHAVTNHPTLGMLHAGFYALALGLVGRLSLTAKAGPYDIEGHSLGAALALLLGALLIDDGLPPIKIGAFAPPRVGGTRFVKIATSVPFCAYRFGNDPVPDVPFTLPGFPYAQVPLKQIGMPKIDPFECHHIANYVEGVHALSVAAAPVAF